MILRNKHFFAQNSVAPQGGAAIVDPQRRKRRRIVRLVVGGETEFLRRRPPNRNFQDENRPRSGGHKRNGDGRRQNRNDRRQKYFRSVGTFGGHRLPGHLGRQFRGLGVVSVGEAIEKRREITCPGPSLQFYGPVE